MSSIMYEYKCIGCGKEHRTKFLYSDGWICVQCRSKVKITVKCSECGADVKVSWDTYRMKNPNIPWRCRSCNDKYRNYVYEQKSDKEKLDFVESQRNRSKEYWANLSEEEKRSDHDRRKKLWEKRRLNNDDHIIQAMKIGRDRWWNSLTDEEKQRQWDFMNDGRKIWWDSLTQEERDAHMKHPHDGFTNWFNSLDNVRRLEFLSKVHDGNKKFWDEMMGNQEMYNEWRLKFHEGYQEYLESIDPHHVLVTPNKNESAFMNILNQNGIPFQFQYSSTIIHPDFNKVFPLNPVSGATLVDPLHMWDFCIHTRHKNILVDVDGSIHFKDSYTRTCTYSGITYKELDYKKFCDSQRPYQTDGLDAYAVLCYDDHLTNQTIVQDIITGYVQPLESFIAYLTLLNLSDEELREVMRFLEESS